MADRSLRFDLIGRDRSLGRTLKKGERDTERFRQRISGVGVAAGGAALAGLAILGAGALKLAGEFDDAYDTIRVGTGKTGKSLAGLKDDFRAVVKDIPTDFASASTAVAELNRRTGQTGKPLQALAKRTLELTRLTGGDLSTNIASVTRLFGDWGIKTGDQSKTLDKLFRASQATGVGVDQLAQSVVKFGAPLRQLGFSFDESITLLAKFEKEGVNSSLVMSGMKIALGKLAKAGKDPQKGFLDLTQRIKDAGSSASANKIAIEAFGQRAGPDMAAAIREGRLSIRDLQKQISGGKDTILGAAKDAEDFGEKWKRVTNKLKLLAEPVVTKGLDILSTKMGGLEKFLTANLAPRLGGLKQAWADNQGAILGLLTPFDELNGKTQTADQRAQALADSLREVVEGAGKVARGGQEAATGLNAIADSATNNEGVGASIHKNLVRPLGEFIAKSALGQGTGRLFRAMLRDTKADLGDLGITFGSTAGATDRLKAAGDRHIGTLRAEKDAVNALKDALRGEEASELDVRQAKLNVATAQERLTGLVKSGKRGSLEYRQAQLDLKRAQLDLKAKTEEYKGAQQRASAATGGAMRVAQTAQGPYKKFGDVAKTAGGRAYTMGKSARDGLNLIQSRRVSIIATFGFKAGKTLGKTSIHDIVGATGGYVTPTAIVPRRLHTGGFLRGPGTETSDSIPARLSKGEYVVNAKAVRKVGRDALDDINAQGFATGGPVLDAKFPDGGRMGRVARRFEGVIDKAIARMAGKMDKYAQKLAAGFAGTGKPAITRFIRSTDPLNYGWGGAGPNVYDCSGIVGAVHLGHMGRPYGHGQRIYTTSSIRAGVLGLKPGLGGVLDIGVTSGTGHMAGRYGGKRGLGFEAESSRTGIKIGAAASSPESFARKFHLAKGGPVEERMVASLAQLGLDVGGDAARLRVNGKVFDNGGTLAPGLNLVANRTGKPEPLTPAGAGIDRKAARMIAEELVGAMARAGLGATYLDGQKVDSRLRTARQWNERRQ